MTTQQLSQLVPYLVAGLLVLGFLLFLLSLHQLHRGRKGPYWRIRRQAGQRGGRLFLLSVALFGLALAIGFFSGLGALALNGVNGLLHPSPEPIVMAATPTDEASVVTLTPTNTETATATSTPTLTPTETATVTQTPSPTFTSTATPTVTPTQTDTPTPTATYETALNLYQPAGARAPDRAALVRILSADTGVSENQTPLDPRASFSPGTRRIYLFFTYRGMENGVAWTRVLYRNGAPLQGSTLLWSLGSEGSSYFFFGNADGYPPGSYRVEFLLGDDLVSDFTFEIEEQAAA